jgi:uncharacterized protein YecE (DUF72 family)
VFCENVVLPAVPEYAVSPLVVSFPAALSQIFGGNLIHIDKPPGQLPRFLVGTSEPGVSDFPFVEFIGSFYRETALSDLVPAADHASHARFSVLVNRATSNPVIWDPAVGRSAMARHLDAARPLVERGQLYTFLIQLDEEQGYDEKVLVYLRQLAALPLSERIPVHVEFRHISWHARAVLETLSGDGIGIANVEQPTSIDAFPLKAYATTELGYVRYCRRKPYTDAEVAERVRGQVVLGKKVADAAVVWSREYNDLAEDNAASCIGLMRERMTEVAVK